jgi:hypothetical protein
MAEHKDKPVRNSWMEDDVLVAAAVKAVEEGRPLPWNKLYRVNGSTWGDYKRAAAWVSRERKKRSAVSNSSLSSYMQTTTQSSKAAIALVEADFAKEAEKAEKENRIHSNAHVDTKSLGEKVVVWVKEAGRRFVWLLILIPVGMLLGFQAGTGLFTTVILPSLLVLGVLIGILILIFRFVRAMASSVKSGKPIKKNWYE